MAAQKSRTVIDEDAGSFAVTCVIGTVQLGVYGPPAHVAAMTLIAEHDAPGVYSFPLVDGGTQRVTVEKFIGDVTTTER